MEKEKTLLERIKEQLEQKMTRAIVTAIKDGAKIEKCVGGVIVNGVFIVRGNRLVRMPNAVVLTLNSPEIDELFESSEEEMKAKADELRKELQEIETKLNSK